LATELGSAFISVGLGTNSLAGDIKKAFGSAESSGSDAGKSAGKGFGSAFGVAAAALGALGIGSFFKSAVSGAAELQQSVGAVDSVFKGSAGQMHEWAKSAATDVGLSANEFNELGTLIGSQLKNGGTAMDELAPKTKSLISTGADLASMFGGTTSEAVAALSSALKGERDPIERYGVSLNQAKIDAEAAALGFKKVDGALSAEANQAATLSLIMKQTADAHGNFASEADTLAHKQQVLNAQWANGKARIGDALLPAVSGLTGALSSALGPAIDGAVAGIKTITGGAQGLYDLLVKGDFSSAFATAFKVEEDSPLVGALFTVRSYVVDLVGGFRAMFAAFKAGDGDVTSAGFAGFMERVGNGAREVTGGIRAMFEAFKAGDGDITSSGFAGFMEQVGGTARQVFDALAPTIASLMPMFAALVPQLFALFSALSPTSLIFQALLPVLPQIASTIGTVVAAILPLIMSLTSQLLPIITQLVADVLPPLIAIFSDVVTAIAPLITQIAGLLIPIIQALMPVVVTVFSVVAEIIKNAMQIVQGIIQVVTGIISGDWDKVWTGIGNIFGGIWNTIVAVVKGALQLVGQVVISGLGLIGNFVGSTLSGIGNFFASTWNNVIGGVGGFIGNLLGFFTSLPGKIMSALSGAGTWLLDVGRNIVQGLIDGAKGMVNNAVQAIKDVGGAMLDGVKGFLGIHSPSRVFKTQVGMMIGAGVVAGLVASQGGVTAAVNDLVTVPTASAFGAGTYSASVMTSRNGGDTYVQNPFTGEYLLAQVDGRVGAGMDHVASIKAGRSR